ncbi:MAG: DUF1501 domain-containing protein [Armatimonadota bacterium]
MMLAAAGTGAFVGPTFLQRAAFAADSRGRRRVLICIFLRGAADGLSVVVPHAERELYRLRTSVAIPRPGGEGSAIDLDGFFGLHPSLGALMPYWRQGHLGIVHACGSPHPTRSHFDAMDYMESGAPGNKSVRDGWLARATRLCPEDQAKASSPFRAVAMGAALPRILQGDSGALAIPDLRTFGIQGDIAPPAPDRRRRAPTTGGRAVEPPIASGGFEALYDKAVGDVLYGTGKESFAALDMLKAIDVDGYVPANGAAYPSGRFGDSLRQLAQLIKADVGMRIGFADIGGWDTHANQTLANNPAQGNLANNLRTLGNGIAAFARDLGDRMDDVVVLTMSEFGRTARQNGTGGTDHGHATCFLALGGGVSGGKVHGAWPGLAPEQLHEGRDLAMTTDFRTVFREVAAGHLGIARPDALFPGFEAAGKPVVGLLRG